MVQLVYTKDVSLPKEVYITDVSSVETLYVTPTLPQCNGNPPPISQIREEQQKPIMKKKTHYNHYQSQRPFNT